MTPSSRNILGASGERLHVEIIPPESARHQGTVLFCHGLGEHSARHRHVAEAYVASGWRAVLFDLPGHGRSTGKRGHIADFEDFTRDLARVRAATVKPDDFLLLHGHSMGALVVMRAATSPGCTPGGAVLSAPWLDLKMAVSGWKLRLGRIALRHFPALALPTGVRRDFLSSDQSFLAGLPDPHLVHRKISAGLYFGATRIAARVAGAATAWRCPMLMLLGEEDPVIRNESARRFFEKAPHPTKTLRVYPGMRHEPHNETGRETVLRDILAWTGGLGDAG